MGDTTTETGLVSNEKQLYQIGHGRTFLGRQRIYTRYEEVNETNVLEVVNETSTYHYANAGDIIYLRNYWKGDQPILRREKDVRPEICNKVVENRAEEIMSFKTGYQSSEPIQYVLARETEDKAKMKAVANLNDDMFIENKDPLDSELMEWMCLCGVGYRMVESDDEEAGHGVESEVLKDTAPYTLYTCDPRTTYVVYSSMYHRRPVCSVQIGTDEDRKIIYTVHTPKWRFVIDDGALVSTNVNPIGLIPIIEYDLNSTRQGVFERVLPILNAINLLDSNRLDGIEQVVQALYLFKNCDVDEDTFLEMLELGAVKVSTNEGVQGDVTLITNDLDQGQTQTVKDDLIDSMCEICGMPNRNQGGANDTGSAVYMRDGYSMAEARAKSYELQFKRSERDFLRVVLRVCEIQRKPYGITLRDIDVAFNRRNYDNVLTKAQAFSTLVQTNKIHLLDCFKSIGMFSDPEAAYARAVEWMEDQERKAQEKFEKQQLAASANPAKAFDSSDNNTGAKIGSDHDGDGYANEDNHGRKSMQTGVPVTTHK